MTMELNTLIEKIKSDGVAAAEKRSGDIIADAKRQAKEIVDNAHREKAAAVEQAKLEAERLEESAKHALRQASRDVLLSLRGKIIELFDAVVKEEVSKELSGDNLHQVLIKVVESFAKEKDVDLEILLSEKDKDALEKALMKSLKDTLRKGVTLKAASGLEQGFRVGEKDKNFYYDFTDEAVTETFIRFLNPKVARIIAGAAGNGE
ncbi:MAG: V-type ATP synthase subunit E [Candidatus Omnitrophota bacterium]